jgi:hypothetical protein
MCITYLSNVIETLRRRFPARQGKTLRWEPPIVSSETA